MGPCVGLVPGGSLPTLPQALFSPLPFSPACTDAFGKLNTGSIFLPRQKQRQYGQFPNVDHCPRGEEVRGSCFWHPLTPMLCSLPEEATTVSRSVSTLSAFSQVARRGFTFASIADHPKYITSHIYNPPHNRHEAMTRAGGILGYKYALQLESMRSNSHQNGHLYACVARGFERLHILREVC